jgi:hypothetical protein
MILLRSTAPFFALTLPTIWLVVWLVSPCNWVWPMGCDWFQDMVDGGIACIYGDGTDDVFK